MKKKPKYTGCVLFDGKLNIMVKGEKKTLQIDYLGSSLKTATPGREVLVLLRGHAEYNEIDTGYLLRKDEWEEKDEPCFGLSTNVSLSNWGIHNFHDVIAWGYADEENNHHTVEEVETKRREVLAKIGDGPCKGLQIKVRDKGSEVQLGMESSKDDLINYARANVKYGPECMFNFIDFHKKHPEIVEMHFFTSNTKWEEDEDAAE